MSTDWMQALQGAGLKVTSARDGAASKGFLDTGNYALNWAISGRLLGGWPLGHTVEIFGDPSTGKSFLAARAIAMAQAAGGVALLDDTEAAWNPEHATRLGVDVDRLAYRTSRTVREHLETARAFIAAYRASKVNGPGVLVCDSLSLLSTEHELEVGLSRRDLTRAAEIKAFFRIVGGELASIPVAHVSTSHTIANVGDAFNPRTTSGGGGPKFHATVRLDLRSRSKIKVGTEVVGVLVRAVVEKNRIVAPWREVRLTIPFDAPISRASGLLPLLVTLGVLETQGQKTPRVSWRGRDLGLRYYRSKDAALRQDEEAEALLDAAPEILEEVDAMLAAGGLGAPGTSLGAADVGEDSAQGEEGEEDGV